MKIANKPKLLLTGGSGFIGRNICESFLSEKYEIIAPSSKVLNLSDTNCVDDFFSKHQFDFVIHSACMPGHRNAKNSQNLFYTNTRMFANLARHSDKYKRMLLMGSGAIYDNQNYKEKMSEDYAGVFVPKDEHGFSKYVISKMLANYSNIIDLRIFGVFGKYEDYEIRFISNAICKTLFDLPITIKQNRNFDYIYIDDLINVVDLFLSKAELKYKAYNVTPDKSESLENIGKLIREISGKKNEIKISESTMGLEYSGNNSRLKSEFGSELNLQSIHKTVAKLYCWYQKNLTQIEKGKLLYDK